jgi:hypothetical protein
MLVAVETRILEKNIQQKACNLIKKSHDRQTSMKSLKENSAAKSHEKI